MKEKIKNNLSTMSGKEEIASVLVANFLKIKDLVDGSMISDVATELGITVDTVRNYVNGKFILGRRANLHQITQVYNSLNSKVAVLKELLKPQPATA